jgi:ribosomal protein S18 acetylase RimI-like enzyme
MKPAIRLATLTDLPAIRLLWRDMAAELDYPYPENVAAYLDTFTRQVALSLSADPPTVFFFLGQSDPDLPLPDAFVVYEIQQRQLGEPKKLAFVHYCYTAPHCRQSGMATALITMAVEHMIAGGLTVCEATTEPDKGQRWADLGFVDYEHRYHVTTARMAVGLDARRQRAIERTTNGLDPDSVPPSLDDLPAEE